MKKLLGLTSTVSILSLAVASAIAAVQVDITSLVIVDPPEEVIGEYETIEEAIQAAYSLPDGEYILSAGLIVTGNEVTPPDPPDPNEPTHPPAVDSNLIVYTQVPRTTSKLVVRTKTGEEFLIDHLDTLDSLPEVGRQFSNFNAPGQLILLNIDTGEKKVIYDCFTTDEPCVPFDASVSLDGKKIIFAVYRADSIINQVSQGYTYPIRSLSKSGNKSEIYVYDIETQQLTPLPYVEGNQETSPIFLTDGKIMFASDRDKQFAPYLHNIGSDETTTPRLFIADLDGQNVVPITPHSMAGTMHPYLLANGRVAETTKWMTHGLPYIYDNGSTNYPTTTGNMWILQDIDQRGGDPTALYGSHHNQWNYEGKVINFKALHFIGQRANGEVLVTNYYRGNNLGLGDVIGFTLEPKLLEGPAPDFLPRNKYPIAMWSVSNDNGAGPIGNAKIGFPEGTPDGQVMMSVGKGYCSSVAWNMFTTPDKITDFGKIGCDVGIYKTTVIPSQDLSDLELIVDEPEWHEFGARVVVSRDIAPAEITNTSDGTCVVASSDAGSTDAHNYNGYDFNSSANMHAAANNGTEIDGIPHSEVTGIRFYKVLPNTERKTNPNNTTGNKLELLGDVPLLADKSFKAQLPCDTSYFMTGIDSQGRVLKRDQLPQSLRPGELRVCTGCHLHGSEGRPYDLSIAYTATPVQLLNPTPVPTYTVDILPILQNRCGSCHATGATTPLPLFNFDSLVWDFFQKEVPASMRVQTGADNAAHNKKYGLNRPMISKYVHSQYARESLLYWKAANQRTDGRTDEQYSDDIDFGANHPTSITSNELKIIAEWLDSGATK